MNHIHGVSDVHVVGDACQQFVRFSCDLRNGITGLGSLSKPCDICGTASAPGELIRMDLDESVAQGSELSEELATGAPVVLSDGDH